MWLADIIWLHSNSSTLAQAKACCLTTLFHYLNQCWLIISEISYWATEGNFTGCSRYLSLIWLSKLLIHYWNPISQEPVSTNVIIAFHHTHVDRGYISVQNKTACVRCSSSTRYAASIASTLDNCQRNPRKQSSWGQHGAHLGPVGPRWAPCWPNEPCYQGILKVSCMYDLL